MSTFFDDGVRDARNNLLSNPPMDYPGTKINYQEYMRGYKSGLWKECQKCKDHEQGGIDCKKCFYNIHKL